MEVQSLGLADKASMGDEGKRRIMDESQFLLNNWLGGKVLSPSWLSKAVLCVLLSLMAWA